jgi:hypothetical protein
VLILSLDAIDAILEARLAGLLQRLVLIQTISSTLADIGGGYALGTRLAFRIFFRSLPLPADLLNLAEYRHYYLY